MEVTVDLEPYLYDKLNKEAKKYQEEIEDVIIRAIEDYYG